MSESRMNPLAEMVLIAEIVHQTKIARCAALRLHLAHEGLEASEIWCSIHSILVSAGIISKILWPSRKKSMKRGQRLRSLLRIDDKCVLSERKFRNHFEHYDERIEDWFEVDRSTVYSDSSIDISDQYWGMNHNPHHRAYNPVTQVLKFRNESIDLSVLLRALDDLRKACSVYAL